ncbi:hypothetical protein Cgig2_015423 [Carnegiea gigantea]|uniref:DUF4283 domain-containing protein n=1 Tax=Carnegiea gigantea TaxID=171969 RepID=A0A9Q1GUK5_9CARY|nr:hypothetical protein Cgig2_015423 [Carnegiea gigantea]
MKGFINRIWTKFEIDKILLVKKGLFLVRFAQLQDKIAVENKGIYYFDKKPFLVKGWDQEMDLHTESIKSLPLWVQFSDLDIKYWGLESLSKLGSLLGILLKTDMYTKEKSMLRYARLLIEVPMEGPFPEYIEFFNEYGTLIRQQVIFEWKPSKCDHCGMFGHLEDACRKKQPRKEWRPINKMHIQNESNVAANTDAMAEDNFISVSRRAAARPPSREQTSMGQQNSFQLIHGRVRQLHTNNSFIISVVYGMNTITQRQQLWEDLSDLIPQNEAWCVLGDFNAVRCMEERIGGDPVTEYEIQELNSMMENCELQQAPTVGAFYTWTNKKIWSRLDRVLINDLWHAIFDYTYIKALPMGISDHSPLLLQFILTPKPRTGFQYCEMWSTQLEFFKIMSAMVPSHPSMTLEKLYKLLDRIKPQLLRLKAHKFADLQGQQLKARIALEEIQSQLQLQPMDPTIRTIERQAQDHYNKILTSSLSLMKQQSKMEWLTLGDENNRIFFTKAKQRRMATYVYSLKDASGEFVEGFEAIGRIMLDFYKHLLGPQSTVRSRIDMEVIRQGATLTKEQQVALCKDFTEKDIREAIFSVPNIKSPGPDGLSSGV